MAACQWNEVRNLANMPFNDETGERQCQPELEGSILFDQDKEKPALRVSIAARALEAEASGSISFCSISWYKPSCMRIFPCVTGEEVLVHGPT